MVTTVAKRPKIEDAQFWDLTIDNNQNLYITIKELGLIQKITKQGGQNTLQPISHYSNFLQEIRVLLGTRRMIQQRNKRTGFIFIFIVIYYFLLLTLIVVICFFCFIFFNIVFIAHKCFVVVNQHLIVAHI